MKFSSYLHFGAAILLMAPLVATADSTTSTPGAQACHPTIKEARTDFPQRAQAGGEHGTVVLRVTLNADGSVAKTQTQLSSGFDRLDAAARNSVQTQWKFDVASCAAQHFPISRLVEIQYERTPLRTFTATQFPGRQRLQASSQDNARCSTADGVTSCVKEIAAAETSLAQQR